MWQIEIPVSRDVQASGESRAPFEAWLLGAFVDSCAPYLRAIDAALDGDRPADAALAKCTQTLLTRSQSLTHQTDDPTPSSESVRWTHTSLSLLSSQ